MTLNYVIYKKIRKNTSIYIIFFIYCDSSQPPHSPCHYLSKAYQSKLIRVGGPAEANWTEVVVTYEGRATGEISFYNIVTYIRRNFENTKREYEKESKKSEFKMHIFKIYIYYYTDGGSLSETFRK